MLLNFAYDGSRTNVSATCRPDFANIILISSFKDETQFVYEESLPLTFERLSSFQLENYHKFSFVPVFTRKKVVSECIVKGIKTDSVFSGAYFEEIISNGALNLILKNMLILN